jgi:hypothetical protein
MTPAVLLDSAPLGLLTAPPRGAGTQARSLRLAGLIAAGVRVIVPVISHIIFFVLIEPVDGEGASRSNTSLAVRAVH